MPGYLFSPPPVMSALIRGSGLALSIHRQFFVGRNYHAHTVEIGRPVDKSVERAFFLFHEGATE